MDTPFSSARELCLLKSDHHPQLHLGRVSHLFRNRPFSEARTLVLQCRYSCSLRSSRRDTASKPINPWEWSSKEKIPVLTPSILHKNPIEGASRWAPLLLFRVLLLVGVGLGSKAPAVAGAPPPSSKVLVKKEVEKATQNLKEKGAPKSETSINLENCTDEKGQADAEKKGAYILGEAFWKEMEVSRGSIIPILKGILEVDPTDRDALTCLAKNLVDSDDAPHALTVIEKLELLEPYEMEWKYLKAFAYDMSGQFKQAKIMYEEILKVEPFSSKAIQGLMMAMDELDEIDALVVVVEKTLAKARQENNVLEARNISMLIGQFYMMKGHLRDALEHYQEMLEEDDKDFRPHLCLGIIHSALGEKAKAEQQFKAYEKLCPKDFPERKYLDALMRKAKQGGQKRFEEKQKEKYVRIPKKEQNFESDK